MARVACPTCAHVFCVIDTQLETVARCPYCTLSFRPCDNLIPKATPAKQFSDVEGIRVASSVQMDESLEREMSPRNRLSTWSKGGILFALSMLAFTFFIHLGVASPALLVCLILALVACACIVVIIISVESNQREWQQELKKAETAYRESLGRLKMLPTDPNVREKALALGRRLAQLQRTMVSSGRELASVTVFDEVALMNDINAACAGATTARPSSTADEIRKFVELCRDGIITHEELESVKNRLTGVGMKQVEDVIDLLRGLYQLRKQGVLTESEFTMKKWDILSRRIVRS